MKLKKQYKTIILIIVILVFSFFLFKKNDIQISDIFNKNNKLATYTFSSSAVAKCDQGINIDFNSITTSSPGVVYKGSNYIVIDATYTNLKTTEGQTGYSGYAFINKNGCAVEIGDVTSISSNNSSLCTNLMEYTNSQESLKYWGEYYNKTFVTSNYCSEKIVIKAEEESDAKTKCETAGGQYIDPDDAASIAVLDKVKNGKRYQIINAATTTLPAKQANGEITNTGYEGFAYLKDGCTGPLRDTTEGSGFATLYGNNNEICSAMRNYIVNERSKENPWNWNYWATGVYGDVIKTGVCPESTKIEKISTEIESDAKTKCEKAGGQYIDPDAAANIAVFDKVKDGKRYQIINAETTTLPAKQSNGEITNTGYEGFAYLKDGCTGPLIDTTEGSGFATLYGNNNEICSAMHNYIVNVRSKENPWNWIYWVRMYNQLTYAGDRINPEDESTFKAYKICSDDKRIEETSIEIESSEKTCSIEWDKNNDDGFEGAYFKVNGSAQSLTYYIDTCGCSNDLKDFIATGQKETYESKCGIIEENNTCVNKKVTDDTGFERYTYYFNGLVQGENCSSWIADDTEKDGTDNIGEFYYYKNNPNNSKCYYSYSKEATGKTCNYVYDSSKGWSSYLVNGCAWELGAFIDKCAEVEENKCGDESFKQFLIQAMNNNNWFSNHIDMYNSKCSDKINYGTVTVYQNDDAYGLSCNANGWEYNEKGSCKKSATSGTINGPDVSNLSKYGTRKFVGWSTTKSCNTIDRTTNTFDINFTGNKTYYACYEPTSTNSALFDSNTKKVIDIKYVKENESCNENSMTLTNKYYRKTTKLYSDTLADNAYCNVVCEDDVEVNYPNFFETVPAGQYFELMYEPEITATRQCTSEFNYEKWKEDYETAVENEIQSMNALNQAKAYLQAAKNMSTNSTCCQSCSCETPPCGCCESGTYGSKTENYYTSTTSSKSYSTTASYNTCSGSTKSSVKSDAEDYLATAKNNYNAAVTKRLKLEKNNLQCYTILDQTDNNTKSYSEVFKENYKYIKNNSTETFDINSTEYNIKTPKVTVDSLNDSTSSTYSSYISNSANAGISSTVLSATNNSPIGDTVKFYATYPSLRFKYDDGSLGAPKELESILNMAEENSQILAPEAHVKLDTGAFTSKDESGTYTKSSTNTDSDNDGISTLSENFYVDGNRGYHINFTAYTATSITREVKYYFTYREPNEYFSQKQNGSTTLTPIGDDFISLTRMEGLTTKTGEKIDASNNVYPVALKAVQGDYYNELLIQNQINKTFNAKSDTYFGTTNFGTNFKGIYTCSYEITNDILTLSQEKQNFKDLKSNTIFRSVATDSIDPNNRADSGALGDNWLNEKGTAVRKNIEAKESNLTTTKNTYNPENLEYSFTLTPMIINAIKGTNNPNGYNSLTNYDDFNLDCTESGFECTSRFLTYLSEGKIVDPDSPKTSPSFIDTYSNYRSINDWNSEDLEEIRKTWKYYIQSFEDTDLNHSTCESLGNNLYACLQGKMTLENYNKLYEKWGVLP